MSRIKNHCAAVLGIAFMAVGLISFRILASVSFETDENVLLVTLLGIGSLALGLCTAWKDLLHLPSLLTFIAATLTLCQFLAGRVSYLAFYFSGDVMNTGLSPWFIAALICFIAALVCSIASMRPKEA